MVDVEILLEEILLSMGDAVCAEVALKHQQYNKLIKVQLSRTYRNKLPRDVYF